MYACLLSFCVDVTLTVRMKRFVRFFLYFVCFHLNGIKRHAVPPTVTASCQLRANYCGRWGYPRGTGNHPRVPGTVPEDLRRAGQRSRPRPHTIPVYTSNLVSVVADAGIRSQQYHLNRDNDAVSDFRARAKRNLGRLLGPSGYGTADDVLSLSIHV